MEPEWNGNIEKVWIPSYVYVLVNRLCGRPCHCRKAKMFKSFPLTKLWKKNEKKPPALDIFKISYSVMCEMRKCQKMIKKWTHNEETIPLKESLEMFYSLRVALIRRCKVAFLWSVVASCIARTTFFLFLSPSKQTMNALICNRQHNCL